MNAALEDEANALQQFVGRTQTRVEVLELQPLRRFALASGAPVASPEAQPPLAHWAFFLPDPADSELSSDGHARVGSFLPDTGLPQRMFAASAMTFHRPLALGRQATLTSTIAEITPKEGRSGALVFVEIDRVIEQDGSPCMSERQSLVYRPAGSPVAMPEPLPVEPEGERWLPTETHLFRFSAATFNSHRIHYDHPYATEVEGYPSLVVHGPFTAARLAGLAMRNGPLKRFSFRAMAPLFLGQPIFLRSVGKDAVEAVRCDGAVAMRAEFSRG